MRGLKRYAACLAALTCALFSITLGGCEEEALTLAEHRAIWEKHEPNEYQYTLQLSCFCLPEYTGPVRVKVTCGETVSVTYLASGEPAAQETFSRYDTLDKIFDFVADAYARNAHEILTTFDPDYGYPTAIHIDYIEFAVDDELSVIVTDFAITDP
jgi:hypothetical protein